MRLSHNIQFIFIILIQENLEFPPGLQGSKLNKSIYETRKIKQFNNCSNKISYFTPTNCYWFQSDYTIPKKTLFLKTLNFLTRILKLSDQQTLKFLNPNFKKPFRLILGVKKNWGLKCLRYKNQGLKILGLKHSGLKIQV